MYADVNEISPGAAHRLQSSLRQSAATASQSSLGSGLTAPPPVHLSPEYGGQGLLVNEQSSNSRYRSSSIVGLDTATSSSTVLQNQTTTCQYLLLCINTKRLKTLEHIDVVPSGNDQYLFRDIRDRYKHIRKAHEWNLGMLMPSWIHTPSWLVPYIQDLSFSVPISANFIRVCIHAHNLRLHLWLILFYLVIVPSYTCKN